MCQHQIIKYNPVVSLGLHYWSQSISQTLGKISDSALSSKFLYDTQLDSCFLVFIFECLVECRIFCYAHQNSYGSGP